MTLDPADDRIKLMAEATMTVVRNLQRPVDVMKVQVVDEAATPAGKAIYAVGRFQWGAFRDAEERAAKYWLLGPLKPYAAYLFSVFRDLTWQCAGRLGHTPPCDGCRRCRSSGAAAEGVGAARSPLSSRWWHVFLPRTTASASSKVFFFVCFFAFPSDDSFSCRFRAGQGLLERRQRKVRPVGLRRPVDGGAADRHREQRRVQRTQRTQTPANLHR